MRCRIRAGDSEAFRLLFDEHAGAIFRHAARVTADLTAAEDIVSLTFLEAWRLRERLCDRPAEPSATGQEDRSHQPGDGLRGWLLGIATNLIRNRTRAARRHRAALARLPARGPDPDFSDELVERLAKQAELAATRTALARLGRREREVIALCVWSGLDYAAAAEALSVPIGTVRSRLSRARARLRRLTEAELVARAAQAASRERSRKSASGRELTPLCGQVIDDRTPAVRSHQEGQ